MKPMAAAAFLALAPLASPAQEGERHDCVIDPPVVIALASSVPGLLTEVAVSRGDHVRAGQLVARLDSTLERATRDLLRTRVASTAAIEAQSARLAFIESRQQRVRELFARGVATQETLDEIDSAVIEARSILNEVETEQAIAVQELARAEAAVALREIHSPIDGIVQERTLSPGEYMHQESHVAVVVQLDPLHVETFVPVELYGSIAIGDEATVLPAAPVEGAHTATVKVVDRVFDAASGTFGVRLELPNPDGALPGGHRCKVVFPGPPSN
ncbi:efflux RND transporter periplasmic adaptor subunit [Albimonas pacifica]|uniref:RND family efflux transporter, MFP subunit n=1 Tax=Albimonas pacifica TaxID=1114924 RepID=A0A1I3HUQ0_9RHOB|nr:efflux RND transporter periplasmic adaptor subunit [Albimonas pacifica]SFI39411.1 RND family efflux transporter, MFP subunit [Albimonas pacifica]